MNEIECFIVVPTVLIGIVSICFNIWVIHSVQKLQRMYRHDQSSLLHGKYNDNPLMSSHDDVICKLIFWLAIIDLLYGADFILDYGIDWTTVNAPCLILGIIGQFLSVCTALWRVLIASYLFYLLKLNHGTQETNTTYHITCKQLCGSYLQNAKIFNVITILIIVLCLVGSIIPLIWNNDNHYTILYNFKYHSTNYGTECWVESYFQMIFYGTLMISVCFDICVLITAVWKYYQTKWYTNAYLYLIKRLLAWVFIFLLIRIFPFLDRLLALIVDNYHTPLWLVLLHNYSLASVGIANGMVWYFNRKIKPHNTVAHSNSLVQER